MERVAVGVEVAVVGVGVGSGVAVVDGRRCRGIRTRMMMMMMRTTRVPLFVTGEVPSPRLLLRGLVISPTPPSSYASGGVR